MICYDYSVNMAGSFLSISSFFSNGEY
jgi:hypothetical protein